jgi:hypothetical protein
LRISRSNHCGYCGVLTDRFRRVKPQVPALEKAPLPDKARNARRSPTIAARKGTLSQEDLG